MSDQLLAISSYVLDIYQQCDFHPLGEMMTFDNILKVLC